MPLRCAKNKKLLPLGRGSTISTAPLPSGREHNRFIITLASLHTSGTYISYAHSDCVCNQIVSLRNRVLSDDIKPRPSAIARLKQMAKRLSKLLPRPVPDDWYTMPNMYSGAKRTRYLNATESVLRYGVTREHARIRFFVKLEKKNADKVEPDPRAIQYRRPEFCVDLARYLKPIEAIVYPMRGKGKWFPRTRLIAKGLSQQQRAMLLFAKWRTFDDPVAIVVDATRFDQHVGPKLLRVEHLFYTLLIPDSHLQQLLSWQLVNRGKTTRNIRYRCRGRRMSGDMNTAIGNCILMILMVADFMQGRRYDLLDDGDDCLIIVERSNVQWLLASITPWFEGFGMKLKVECTTDSFPAIKFCQSHPVERSKGVWTFVRDYRKIFSTALSGTKWNTSDKGRRRLLKTIGLCEKALAFGIPVLQAFSEMLIRSAGTETMVKLDQRDSLYYRVKYEYRAMGVPLYSEVASTEPSATSRESFAIAFGMEPSDQVELENRLASIKLQIHGLCEFVDEPAWLMKEFIPPQAVVL